MPVQEGEKAVDGLEDGDIVPALEGIARTRFSI
jgi:hypothetical protein